MHTSEIQPSIALASAGLKLDKLPNLKGWLERIAQRPGVKKGLEVPSKGIASKLADHIADPTADPDIRKRLEESEAKVASAKQALAK